MDIKLLSGALGAEISGVDLKDTSLKNFEIIFFQQIFVVTLASKDLERL